MHPVWAIAGVGGVVGEVAIEVPRIAGDWVHICDLHATLDEHKGE